MNHVKLKVTAAVSLEAGAGADQLAELIKTPSLTGRRGVLFLLLAGELFFFVDIVSTSVYVSNYDQQGTEKMVGR